jgi:hypothetical protein
MSIPNLIDKIKGKTSIDKIAILYPIIIIGVAFSSFGLGRLSVDSNNNFDNKKSIVIEENNNIENKEIEESNNNENVSIKKYVASKNGKMYYSIGCSGAKRIKKENEVWFISKEDAEKSGYELSSTCK